MVSQKGEKETQIEVCVWWSNLAREMCIKHLKQDVRRNHGPDSKHSSSDCWEKCTFFR